jgi:hypothetical protein
MSSKSSINGTIPYMGLSYKDWQRSARDFLDLLQGQVSGSEGLYEGWYDSGMNPFEAAELAFQNDKDVQEAEEAELAASVKSFNTIETIIENSECWTLDKIQVMAFRSWLEAVQHELDLLAKMSLYRPGKWDYWLGYSKNYTPNQEAARIYVAKLDD